MRRRLRQTLLLALITGIAAALVWWVVQHEQEARPAPLTDLDAAVVRRLSVSNAHKPPRRFERAADGAWWMREPYHLPAHADAVARLLAIASARPRTPPQERPDPAKLGLAPPQAVLELDGQRLEFGITDTINGDRYVRSAAGIALVPDRFSAWLLAPAESELDHRLAAPLGGVREVRVDGQPRPELAAAWGRVTTSQVGVAEAPAANAVQVELLGDGGAAVRYAVWRREDGRYAALRAEPALLYPLEEAQLQFLLPPAVAASTEPAVR